MQAQVRSGQLSKWSAFAEFVIQAHHYLPHRSQARHVPTHIRWAAYQMDQLETALAPSDAPAD